MHEIGFTSTEEVEKEGDRGVFTTFVDETEDGIEYPGRVTLWLISKCAYRRNVTVDGRIIRG